MFENKYPYTDFHELNLDWFLQEFIRLKNEITTLQQTIESLDTVTANPTLSGTEPLLTGIEIGDDKYKVPDEVNANPTLSGTETLLTGLEIGDDKYRAPADVTADPDLDGTEPLLAGLQINEDKYKMPERVRLYSTNPPPSSVECGGIQLGTGQVYQVTYVQPNPSGPINTPLNTIRIRNSLFRILPTVSAADVGKFLRVDASGHWVAETVPAAEGEDF